MWLIKTNNMKKIFLLVLLGMTLQLGLAQDMPFDKSGDPGALPGFKKGFRPQIGVSAVGGYTTFTAENADESGLTYGLELSMQCPLLCTKKNYIRQQVGIMFYNSTDSKTDVTFANTSVTLTPEYRFAVSAASEYAAGPILGWNFTKTGKKGGDIFVKGNGFIYGLSASATYHFGSFMLGFAPQYVLGAKQSMSIEGKDIGSDFDFDPSHFRGLIKLGLKF